MCAYFKRYLLYIAIQLHLKKLHVCHLSLVFRLPRLGILHTAKWNDLMRGYDSRCPILMAFNIRMVIAKCLYIFMNLWHYGGLYERTVLKGNKPNIQGFPAISLLAEWVCTPHAINIGASSSSCEKTEGSKTDFSYSSKGQWNKKSNKLHFAY